MVKKLIIITIFLFLGTYLYLHRSSAKITEVKNNFENITHTIAPKPTKIELSGLPNRHLINTIFVPQAPEKNWDQPWQDACEEAALLTVHYYYSKASPNIVTDLNNVFAEESKLGFSHDVNQTQMAQVASSLWNYQTKIIDDPNLEDIKTSISQDIPVIITANGKTLYKENKRFKSGGPWYHALVILGYDDDKQQFTVHDVGTQFGAYFKYSYSLLEESIHDFPISGVKEEIDSGSKKILILLK